MQMATGAIVDAAALADMSPAERRQYVLVPKRERAGLQPGEFATEDVRQRILAAEEKRLRKRLKRLADAR